MKSIEHYEQLAREAKGEVARGWSNHGCRCGAQSYEHPAVGPQWKRCVRCLDYISLGPATDTAEVLVEIRAAEIAASLPSERISGRNLSDCTDGAEYAGWLEHLYDSAKLPMQAGEHAGWLARAIWNHDAEQAETGGEG